MIRNRYNRIPYPARTPNGKGTPTIKMALKLKQHKRKAKGTAHSQQMAIRLSLINRTVSQRQTEIGRTLTIRINHNRSIALECSVINYWGRRAGGGQRGGRGLNRFLRCSNLALGSVVVNIHIEVVRSA